MTLRSPTERPVTPISFGPPSASHVGSPDPGGVESALALAREHLLSRQAPDGHWRGELEGDTILESEYVLLQAILGRSGSPKVAQCANYLRMKQNADGGWSNYPGGPPDVSVSVKAYFALKIAGDSSESEHMRRARFAVLELGGAERVNSFTRFYLAALGQIPYSHCPSVPPELVFLPKWFPLSLYKMSAWTRTIVVPLSLVWAHKPVVQIAKHLGISELYRSPASAAGPPAAARFEGRLLSWPNIFRMLDRVAKVFEAITPKRLRRPGIERAERWMVDHFEGSDGLGAIFPPMVYAILALRCLDYADDSAEVQWAEAELDRLAIEENDSLRLQPCLSPVWDTAWAMVALADAGLPADHEAMTKSADWLLAREIRQPGDWQATNPDLEPSGWAFEYNNRFYTDLDDTALVLQALKRTGRFQSEPCQRAVHRSLCFLLGMQSSDKGWAAFDRDVDNPVLEAVPFADHNAMLDPSCPDITARVLETLGQLGYRRGKLFIDDAIRFLLDRQEPEGCWYGRWGVNYVYGTWQTLTGLAAIGYDMRHPRMRRAVEWLKAMQQENGAWGESCASYDDRSKMGQGDPTPSQTAWGVMGLIAAGEAESTNVRRGIEYLLATQQKDGSWHEPQFTGTGFPKVFYLRYDFYRLYFPLLALARYRESLSTGAPG